MYFDVMKRVCEELGHDFQYKFVTNTTLLTEDMVEFFNDYHFMVCGSFDGEDGCRSTFPRPRFDLLAKIKRNTLAVTVYEENNDLIKLKREVDFLVGENRLNYRQSLAPEYSRALRLKTQLPLIRLSDTLHRWRPLLRTS